MRLAMECPIRHIAHSLTCIVVSLALGAGCHLHKAKQHPDFESLFRQAEALEHQDRIAELEPILEKSLAVARTSANHDWFWKFRLIKVQILLSHSQTEEAAKLLNARDVPIPLNPELQARSLVQHGWLCLRKGDFQGARENLQRAEILAQEKKITAVLPEIEMKLGQMLISTNTSEAEQKCRLAEQLSKQTDDPYIESSASGAIGYLRIKDGRYDEAITMFERALVAGRRAKSKSLLALNLLNSADSYRQLGDDVRAQNLLEQASALFLELKRWGEVQATLIDLGQTAAEHKDFNAANDYLQRAIALSRKVQDNAQLATGLTDLAAVQLEVGNDVEALKLNTEALALLCHVEAKETKLWAELNDARLKEHAGAVNQAAESYKTVIDSGSAEPRAALEASTRLAKLLAGQGKLRAAEQQFRETIAIFEDSKSALERDESRLSYSSASIYLFQEYVDFLAGQGRQAEGFELAESSRARLLTEHRTGTVREYQALSRRLRISFASYWLGPKRSWLWLITPERFITAELPNSETLKTSVRTYRDEIESLRDPIESSVSVGWKLSDALLRPLQENVPAGNRILIVPSGALFDLNFEALPVDRNRPHYFLEDAAISVVPSLSLLLKRQAPRAAGPPKLLLVGDPASPDEKKYPKLAEARYEIQSIAEQFPGSVTMRTGAEARPETYREATPAQFTMVHFAAHAEANRVDPLDSAVILSGSHENFKLYAREIQHQPIQADLVTVSGCSSAGARTYASEGLVGFSWAFLAAGAHHVIGALWEVDDQSTARLMKVLYGALRGGARPADALRTAKESLLKSSGPYRKPYYWAPFEVFSNTAD
jgi:CHAT domain-containing protein